MVRVLLPNPSKQSDVSVVKRKIGTLEAKDTVLVALAKGYTVAQAMESVSRSVRTYEMWRSNDFDFASKVDKVRRQKKGGFEPGVHMEFADFSEKYLGARVFPHMQNVVDVLEGKDPKWQPVGISWERNEPDLAIITMPPEHGKTTTITINYLTYRICMDPNVRIIIVSKTVAMARKILGAIKNRLTHPKYAQMIAAYGPAGGFEHNSDSWSQDRIYVSSDIRDSGEKDPTVEALGIRGHIYGARADIIVMDDAVDLQNAHEWQKQIDWIQAEVMSRIAASGILAAVGTRLASRDLYAELKNTAHYPDGEMPWSYLSMPAVLEFADEPVDWVTLWPKSNMPEVLRGASPDPDEDGLYPKWDGPRLLKKRSRMTPGSWARVYMQQQTSEVEIFSQEAVTASINGQRLPGRIPTGMAGCRPQGMDGLIVLAGLDPASPSGFVAAVVVGLDPRTQKRYVLDVWNKTSMTPDDIRELIYSWTERYGITEWRIEKNAFQTMLTQDRQVLEFLAGRGSVLREHTTGAHNKWDADFGVASMTALFAAHESSNQLIELPGTQNNNMARTLVEQLVTWMPDAPKSHKTDCVMALWFVELACRDRLMGIANYSSTHSRNSFLTPLDRSQQYTVNVFEHQDRFRHLASA